FPEDNGHMSNELVPQDQPPSSPSALASAQRFTPAPGIDPFGSQSDAGGVDLSRYLAAVKRYSWLVALVTVVSLVGAFGVTKVIPPKYVAKGTIWIQAEGAGSGSQRSGPIQAGDLLPSGGFINLLRSFIVLDEAVRRAHLYLTLAPGTDTSVFNGISIADRLRPGKYKLAMGESGGQFTLSTDAGDVVQRGQAGDSIGTLIGLQWAPPAAQFRPGKTIAFTLSMPRDVATQIANTVHVDMDEGGNFMTVSYTGSDPVRAANIINAIVDREVEVAADLKKAKLTELTKILEDQLSKAQSNLTSAENSLESFRVHTATLPSDQGAPIAGGIQMTTNPAYDSYFRKKIEREQLRSDRAAIMRVLNSVSDSGVSVDAMMVIPSVNSSTELKSALTDLTNKQANLRGLRTRYTDATPMVAAAAGEVDSLERRTIPQLALSLVSNMDSRAKTLDNELGQSATDLQQIPTRTIEEQRLSRAQIIAANLYTSLQQSYEQNRLAELSTTPDIRPLDRAMVPRAPMSDSASKILAMGFVAGLGLGLAGAILLDRMDPRVRYPAQVTTELGLPILGTLPRVAKGAGSNSDEMAHVIESLRSIRLNLSHAHGAAGPLLLTISSPGSGDGKSFLSSNLAIAFADAGFNTLLIDGDLRRGGLHRVLKGVRTPGLTDYLSGTATREGVIQTTPYPQLWFIGGGTRKQTAPELLGTPAMRELVLGLRANYQVILIDSPPLGAAVDPFLLATLTGNLAVVLRTGATDRQLARAKLEMMDRLPVRILGAVLNDVKPEGVYRYYGYLAGYEAEEERKAGKDPRQIATPAGHS
ncbi:MAG TPA: polysaccharide biosynthesis tyrosine autokinase, partial [Gemmatimonadales bacterium]|nr:polysaccharide biosynthesis tyrosine autokinase [Gemmatimonadales bacterium]